MRHIFFLDDPRLRYTIPLQSIKKHLRQKAHHQPIKMGLILRHNGALNANPPVGTASHLVVHGSDWLWAVDAVYATTLIVVIGLTYFARQGEKIFHYLFTISLLVGAIAYFTVASDLGSVAVAVSDNLGSHPGTREIFYAKYINWYISPSCQPGSEANVI
jgi:bacteriorhodopsin